MGLGWVYEIANVLSAYLQKAVADMSKKDREAGLKLAFSSSHKALRGEECELER